MNILKLSFLRCSCINNRRYFIIQLGPNISTNFGSLDGEHRHTVRFGVLWHLRCCHRLFEARLPLWWNCSEPCTDFDTIYGASVCPIQLLHWHSSLLGTSRCIVLDMAVASTNSRLWRVCRGVLNTRKRDIFKFVVEPGSVILKNHNFSYEAPLRALDWISKSRGRIKQPFHCPQY